MTHSHLNQWVEEADATANSAAGTASALARNADSAPKRILVIDDDDRVRAVIMEMVADGGFFVSGATSSAAMQEILARPGHCMGAMILDWLLTGETAAELAFLAAELHLPVVLISDNPRVADFAAHHDLQFLCKPFRIAELRNAIETASNGRPRTLTATGCVLGRTLTGPRASNAQK